MRYHPYTASNVAKGDHLEEELYSILCAFSGAVVAEARLLRNDHNPDDYCKLTPKYRSREFLYECKNWRKFDKPTVLSKTQHDIINKNWYKTEYETNNNISTNHHNTRYSTITCNSPERVLVISYANFDEESKRALCTAGIKIIEIGQATWEGIDWMNNLIYGLHNLFTAV